ncbi:unnamed protein product, partial [Prunus brigantina]
RSPSLSRRSGHGGFVEHLQGFERIGGLVARVGLYRDDIELVAAQSWKGLCKTNIFEDKQVCIFWWTRFNRET